MWPHCVLACASTESTALRTTTVMRDHAKLATARSLLDVLDGAFKGAVATLASLCAKDGKLDDARLEEQ